MLNSETRSSSIGPADPQVVHDHKKPRSIEPARAASCRVKEVEFDDEIEDDYDWRTENENDLRRKEFFWTGDSGFIVTLALGIDLMRRGGSRSISLTC